MPVRSVPLVYSQPWLVYLPLTVSALVFAGVIRQDVARGLPRSR